jgi:hypothetical protein
MHVSIMRIFSALFGGTTKAKYQENPECCILLLA